MPMPRRASAVNNRIALADIFQNRKNKRRSNHRVEVLTCVGSFCICKSIGMRLSASLLLIDKGNAGK